MATSTPISYLDYHRRNVQNPAVPGTCLDVQLFALQASARHPNAREAFRVLLTLAHVNEVKGQPGEFTIKEILAYSLLGEAQRVQNDFLCCMNGITAREIAASPSD